MSDILEKCLWSWPLSGGYKI